MKLKINLPYCMYDYKLSGVYKITFEDSCFYIGCSCHLRSRAKSWDSVMRTGKGIPGEDMGAKMINKIRELNNASFDIVELCDSKDLKDKEAFYLDKYKDDDKMLSSYDMGSWKPVLQYRADGIFVKKHVSISAAARYMDSQLTAIQRVLNGERKTFKDMVFVYEKDYHQRRKEIIKARYKPGRKMGRNVLMIDANGKVVNEFKRIIDAANCIKVRPETIRRVLYGRQATTHGFVFKYSEKRNPRYAERTKNKK